MESLQDSAPEDLSGCLAAHGSRTVKDEGRKHVRNRVARGGAPGIACTKLMAFTLTDLGTVSRNSALIPLHFRIVLLLNGSVCGRHPKRGPRALAAWFCFDARWR